MTEIIAIARNTFKEAIRNRILYVILMFALILIIFSGAVSQLTISSRDRIIKDLGFMAINLFGVAIAVFVGVSLVYNELEKKTIYTIVSKPIGRWQFLLGKYFGLLLTVWVNILVMTVFFLAAIHYNDATNNPVAGADHGFFFVLGRSVWRAAVTFFAWGHYPATQNIMPVVAVTLMEIAIITGFAVLFSSFSTPTLSMFFTVLTFIAGRLNEDIIRFADQVKLNAVNAASAAHEAIKLPLAYWFALGAAHVVPNLGAFHRTVERAIYEPQLPILKSPDIQLALIYGVVYTIGILSLSILIFNRRNFK